jgi:hypothetical protein
MGRYSANREYELTKREVNLQYWAGLYFDYALDWVSTKDAEFAAAEAVVPAYIDPPFLRFVNMAMAVTGLDNSGSLYKKSYIIEELIPNATRFVKYIHNTTAAPLVKIEDGETEEEVAIAEYLCFIQHVLYFITDGMLYLSDFQGELTVAFLPIST